jgi:hypothetical protein
MKTLIDNEIQEVLNAERSAPALSIILPLQPEISIKTETAHALKIAADKARILLADDYPGEQSQVVMEKLQGIIDNLVIPPKKKGLIIYISPLFEKVFFVNVPVEEKVIVNEFFELRDIIFDAKQPIPLLLAVISAKFCRVFKGDQYSLSPVHLDIPESFFPYINDAPERVANFSDMTDRKQAITEKFLRHIDNELGRVLHENPLPVIVLGAEKILGTFKKLSKHTASVIACIPGNYDEADINHLLKLTADNLGQLRRSRQKELMDKLQDAAGEKRLSYGITDVWKNAAERKGSLLVAEINYHFSEEFAVDLSGPADEKVSYMQDLVDDTIEKVLRYGGDVEFVDDGLLENFRHIALVHYY